MNMDELNKKNTAEEDGGKEEDRGDISGHHEKSIHHTL
jgi:hypothetical protein